MAAAPYYSAEGAPMGEKELPEILFGATPRADLVHQAVTTELWNRRQGTASTKTRAAVSGGGKKPYRQKGTGRARQGSTRAPHYRHGGVAHGPHPKDYHKSMPQKMRQLAFRSALSGKAADGGVMVLDGFAQSEVSTKQFRQLLEKLEPGRKVVFVLSERNEIVWLSARNLVDVRVVMVPGLSTLEVVNADTLIFTPGALKQLEERYVG